MTNSASPKPPSDAAQPVGRGRALLYTLITFAAVGAIGFANAVFDPPSRTPAAGVNVSLPPTTPEPPARALRPEAGSLIEWDQEKQPGETVYAVDGLVLRLSSRPTEANPTPVLTITGPQGETVEIVGEMGASSARAELAVGRIDPASPVSQVIFNTFSGGAHCCQKVLLIEKLGGRWRTVTVVEMDGDTIADFPKDLDGDGRVEFKLFDNRFLYAFASYGASWAPPKLLAVENGVANDVSAKPQFRSVYAAYIAGAHEDCESNHNNGACAAYVAAAARLGKLDEAWPVMLAAYDKAATWELPTACQSDTALSACPDGEAVTFATFPEALRWFLGDAGYAPPVYIVPANAAGPSFDCDNVKAETLKLICATPELSAADRELASLYWRALATSPDPAGLRADERSFVQVRNSAPPDVFTLLRLYQARGEALANVIGS